MVTSSDDKTPINKNKHNQRNNRRDQVKRDLSFGITIKSDNKIKRHNDEYDKSHNQLFNYLHPDNILEASMKQLSLGENPNLFDSYRKRSDDGSDTGYSSRSSTPPAVNKNEWFPPNFERHQYYNRNYCANNQNYQCKSYENRNYHRNGKQTSQNFKQGMRNNYENFNRQDKYWKNHKHSNENYYRYRPLHMGYYYYNSENDLRYVLNGCYRKLKQKAGYFTKEAGPTFTKWQNNLHEDAKENPSDLLCYSQWDGLSQQVWNLFVQNQQLTSTFEAKMNLKQRIAEVIWNVLPVGRLFVVGSSLSGFGANTSDVDMCLMVHHGEIDQKVEAQKVLRLLQRELNNCGFVEKMDLIPAKIPILKFRDSKTGIDVDLNCNNSVAIRNTHLLNAYSQLDWRVRPLVLAVKLWAQHHHINNAKDMTISSYSLVLMVLHYLQCGVEPNLLPCLHKSYPDKFNSFNIIYRVPITEKMPHFISNNKQSLGELFDGFLDYYANKFRYIDDTLSVRTGIVLRTQDCRIVRNGKNDSRTWKFLCIEEPFDKTNTARSAYDEEIFEKVKGVFKDSFNVITKTKNLNLLFQ